MYKYFFTSPALKQIRKLSNGVQKRILKKLDYYCQKNPFKHADFLTNPRLGSYRFRVGDYRVIFDKDIDTESAILILLVGDRKEIYRKI